MLPLILFGAAYLIGRTTKEETEFADGGTTGAGSFAHGGKIIGYEVKYEKLVDGEREPDIKSFKTKEKAEEFAVEVYGYVENVYEGQYEMADGGMMAKGGKTDNYKYFDLNSKGNFASKINGKNYEVIYRDDKSQMYDLFENGKKIKSSKYIRDVMTFADGGMMAKGGKIKVGDIVHLKGSPENRYKVIGEREMFGNKVKAYKVKSLFSDYGGEPKGTELEYSEDQLQKHKTMAKGGAIEEGDVVIVKSENLKAEVTNVGTDFITVEFIGKRPEGGDKRGTYKKSDLKK